MGTKVKNYCVLVGHGQGRERGDDLRARTEQEHVWRSSRRAGSGRFGQNRQGQIGWVALARGSNSRIRASVVLAAAVMALGLPATPAEAGLRPAPDPPGTVHPGHNDQQPWFSGGARGLSEWWALPPSEFCPNSSFEGEANWSFQFDGTADVTDTTPSSACSQPSRLSRPMYLQPLPTSRTSKLIPTTTPEDAVGDVDRQPDGHQGNRCPPHLAPVYLVDAQEGPSGWRLPPSPRRRPSRRRGGTFRFPIFRPGRPPTPWNVTAHERRDDRGPLPAARPGLLPDQDRFEWATIPILDNTLSEGDQTFTATITNAGGATIGDPASMNMLVTDDDSDATAPQTSFHHPLHDKVYKKTNYLARTIHVFAPGLALEPSGIQRGPDGPSEDEDERIVPVVERERVVPRWLQQYRGQGALAPHLVLRRFQQQVDLRVPQEPKGP